MVYSWSTLCNQQFNYTGTWNCQLKLFDTAAIFKYNQGNWKWYEWVELSKYYHHAKFYVYHIYSVWEKSETELTASVLKKDPKHTRD